MNDGFPVRAGRILNKGYDLLTLALAVSAGVILIVVFASIVYDVVVRTIGWQPPYWTSAATEYAMLLICMFMAPWLTREKAPDNVEALTLVMSKTVRAFAAKLVYLVCAIICLTFAGFAVNMGYDAFLRNEIDYRSIEMPTWLLFAVLALGMAMTGVEFLKYLFGHGDMYSAGQSHQDGI